MHPALWKLYRLRIRGAIRSLAARLKSARGAALLVFSLLVVGMIVGPNLWMTFSLARAQGPAQDADWFGEMIPVVMFMYVVMSVLTSMGERAIYFSPSDVDFLFPAPFSRRQLLLYKILGSVTAAIYVGLLMPTMLIRHVRSWPAAVVGFFLAWFAIHSITMCAQLVAQSVNERAFSRARRFLLYGLIAAAVVALGQAASQGLDGSWQDMLLRTRHSAVAEIVLAPFAVYAKIISAQRLVPDALGWAALGAVLAVSMYGLAIRLDANYLETAVRVSQKWQERRQRAMRGGIFSMQSGRGTRSSRLPQPPWLGGVGPLVWRQVVQALRGSRGAMVLAVIVTVAFGGPFVFGARRTHELSTALPHIVIGVAAYLTLLVSSQAPLGFRADYEQMDLLKSLPIRPVAVAFGQTIVAAMIMALLQAIVFAATAIFVPAAAGELLVAGLFALPFNWIMFGTENFIFLLYPSALVPTGSETFLKMGRVMLSMLAKLLALSAASAVAAIPATIVYFLSGNGLVAGIAGWLALLLPALGILLLITWAYQRYDVSAGVPE